MPTDDDGMRVHFVLDADLRGVARLMMPMVRRSMNGEVGELENLKRVLES